MVLNTHFSKQTSVSFCFPHNPWWSSWQTYKINQAEKINKNNILKQSTKKKLFQVWRKFFFALHLSGWKQMVMTPNQVEWQYNFSSTEFSSPWKCSNRNGVWEYVGLLCVNYNIFLFIHALTYQDYWIGMRVCVCAYVCSMNIEIVSWPILPSFFNCDAVT